MLRQKERPGMGRVGGRGGDRGQHAPPSRGAKNWGEELRETQAHKAQAVSDGYDQQKKVTSYEVSRLQREFDPVQQRYLDHGREGQLRQHESARVNAHGQSTEEHGYNVVNHHSRQPPPNFNAEEPMYMRAPDHRTKYNIVSNKDDARQARVFNATGTAPPKDRAPGGRKPPPSAANARAQQGKDFNIVSNKWDSDHGRRKAAEDDATKQRAAERYWKTHNYNAVEGTFCSDRKEQEYQSCLEHEARHQGQAQYERLPRAYKYGEGNLFDLLTNDTKDAQRLEEVQQTSGKRHGQGSNARVEHEVRVRAEAEALQHAQMVRNRVHPAREAEPLRHGFDIVSGQRIQRQAQGRGEGREGRGGAAGGQGHGQGERAASPWDTARSRTAAVHRDSAAGRAEGGVLSDRGGSVHMGAHPMASARGQRGGVGGPRLGPRENNGPGATGSGQGQGRLPVRPPPRGGSGGLGDRAMWAASAGSWDGPLPQQSLEHHQSRAAHPQAQQPARPHSSAGDCPQRPVHTPIQKQRPRGGGGSSRYEGMYGTSGGGERPNTSRPVEHRGSGGSYRPHSSAGCY
jgi:hypothetical protein